MTCCAGRSSRASAGSTRTRSRRSESTSGRLPFTAKAKKALELALREAVHLEQRAIATEHILLGLAHDGLAAELLAERGLTPARIRDLVRAAA